MSAPEAPTQVTPLSSGSLCPLYRRVWLSCLCLPSPCASGCCVCVRACVCTHACSHCHLASLGRRCLLSGFCEPGMLMSSVMCLLMLLWGPLLCFFVPKLLPLRQSGVSGSVCSLPVCTSLFLRLSVLPPHPLDSMTFRRAQPAPGTGSFLTQC